MEWNDRSGHRSANKKVLVLGGYGNFGKRIVQNLAEDTGLTILIAGRNIHKANLLVSELKSIAVASLEAVQLDINHPDFESQLQALSPSLVIHTSGPFQGQGYQVPKACINVGAHYIDLADDRHFVCDIQSLDDQAKASQVLVVSGASSVPGLSSSVIDHYRSHFSEIHSMDISIAPGNKAERGEATVRGILSYTGKPFDVFRGGVWKQAYGWMQIRSVDFGGVLGKRWLANVDVPDLALFPQRYAVKNEVKFQAGLELGILHWGMAAMAYVAKKGWVKNWSPLTRPIVKASELFLPFGSDKGGMQILIEGLNHKGQPLEIKWSLYAENGVGPYIPTLSTIILAKKLLAGELKQTGATPCLGLYSLDELQPYADKLGIYFKTQMIEGSSIKELSVG